MAEERKTKTEDGVEFPAEAYAYVPDPDKPSTWKLRLWETPQDKETPRQVGLAIAALGPGGFRGNRVEIPAEDLPKVKAKVRAAWKKVNPDKDPEDMPRVIREDIQRTDGDQQLIEYASSANVALRVDREQGIIYGVKVIGLDSANGRRYLPEALHTAAKLYEDKPVNVDHVYGKSARSYRDRIGKLTNVRVAGDGLYADLVVNPRHALAEQLFWDAEHSPSSVGLSHDATGRTAMQNGQVVVESIRAVRSVDLVAEPATTKSLYESAVDAVMAGAQQAQDRDHSEDDEVEDDVDTLPDDAFALILPGGVKIRNRTYPLYKRRFPIHTPAAVKRSIKAIKSNKKLSDANRKHALAKAVDAAKKFGIAISADMGAQQQEAKNMDLSTLTLAELKEARPDLVEALQSASAIEAELVAMKEERDKLAAELEAVRRREQVQKELDEAKLQLDQIPESLRETIFTASDEQRQKIIADVKALLESKQKTPRSSSAMTGTKEHHDIQAVLAQWRK